MSNPKIHLAGPENSFTSCGLPKIAGLKVDSDRANVTCLRCLRGAFAKRRAGE